jgi:hypothetical protein
MSESRVARWRERLRQEGKKAVTVWLSTEEELRLKDLAASWHCSPSEVMQQALAQFHPSKPLATVTATDTEQLRGLIRDELAASSLVPDTVTATVTARVTDTVTATITATLPALVREVVAAMAREHGSVSVPAPRNSDVTDTEAARGADRGHPISEKAAVRARLRQMRSEGKSLEKMARELNAEGVPTLSGEGRWQKGTLHKLLK